MASESPSLPDDATDGMRVYLDELIDATRRANGAYSDFTSEDVVAVLRYRATLFEQYGTDALHQRTLPDDYTPGEGFMEFTEDGEFKSTDRWSFNFDVGMATGSAWSRSSRELTPEQMVDVLTCLADFVEAEGREALGSRETRTGD